jgi:hypothetical protein
VDRGQLFYVRKVAGLEGNNAALVDNPGIVYINIRIVDTFTPIIDFSPCARRIIPTGISSISRSR